MSNLQAGAARRQLQANTAAHYDAHPLEFLTPADEASIRDMQPAPFRRFATKHIRGGELVADIGCGPGRATLFLTRQTVDVVAVDISAHSLRLAQRRAPGGHFLCASNLALPMADGMFDIVVSDGVIHHTPDPRRAFAENARLVRPGGVYYLGVYNRHGYYYYIYTFVGPVLRWLESYPVGRRLIMATMVPLYWGVHLLKSGGTRTWRGTVNFFYDYIITPRASFHTYEEVCAWGVEESLELLEYDPSLGNVQVFVFGKRPVAPAGSGPNGD
jgi:SAM-dependent methyltransferase